MDPKVADDHVVDVDFIVLNRQSKFIPIDEQPNDDIVHLNGSRKADGFAYQPLHACAYRQMRALDFLGVAFPRGVTFRIEVPRVRTPMIRMIAGNPTGLQQSLQLQKDVIFAATKDIGQDLAGMMSDGMPEPPLVLLLAHKGPHVVDFGVAHATVDNTWTLLWSDAEKPD